MNGSSLGLCRYRLILLATLGGVVAVASISADAVVHGDATVSTHGDSECDGAHVPDWIETQAAKATVMLQHDAARSFGYDKASGDDPLNLVKVETSGTAPTLTSRTDPTDPLDHVTLLKTNASQVSANVSQDLVHSVISPNATAPDVSAKTKGGMPVEVADPLKKPADPLKKPADPLKKPASELHSASAPGSNITSRKLALDATVGGAVDGKGGARHSDKRRRGRHKKREVTSYWDKLPMFFALIAVPLLCLVTRNRTDNSKRDDDIDAEDYWDAQRSVGLHSK